MRRARARGPLPATHGRPNLRSSESARCGTVRRVPKWLPRDASLEGALKRGGSTSNAGALPPRRAPAAPGGWMADPARVVSKVLYDVAVVGGGIVGLAT